MTWNNWIIHWEWFWVAEPTQNFANSDEKLLDDRNRPRDQYWFRLQPWRQMGKNDYRQSNRSITEFLKICWWIETSKTVDTIIPLAFDNTDKLTLTQTYSSSASELEKYMKSIKVWKTSWDVKNWNLGIPKTWLYAISYKIRFDFPSWSSISAAPNWLVKLYNIQNNLATQIDSAVWSITFIYWTIIWHSSIQYLEWWTELQLRWYYSTSTSYKCLLRWTIEIMQVS
jgi:hypothetical protein